MEIKFIISRKEQGGKRSTFGAETITKTFKVSSVFDAANVIENCYSDYEASAASACSSMGGELQPDGQCMNSKLCDMEKLSLANTYEGGATTLCAPEETIEGVGLHKFMHTKYFCEGLGGSVETISGKKLCVFDSSYDLDPSQSQ